MERFGIGYPPKFESRTRLLPQESLRVGDKLTITAVPLEYIQKEHLIHKEELQQAIASADGIIMEYFPDEVRQMGKNPYVSLMSTYRAFMPYEEFVANTASSAGKDVWVMDPAHDEKFGILRLLPVSAFIVGTGIATMTMMYGKSKQWNLGYGWIPAGTIFGTGLGLAAAGALVGRTKSFENRSHRPSHFPNEATFRRTVIATGIKELADHLDRDPAAKPKNLLFLYPPVHWKQVKELLKDDAKREQAMHLADTIRYLGPQYEGAFFTTRHYHVYNGKWQLVDQTPIGIHKS